MEKPFALIVEDDRDIAALFRHVLDIAGYRTEVAMDGREAIARLRSALPDIVLLDLTLPGVPGAKILERMRADVRLTDVPVVVVTAHSQAADSLAVEPDLVLLKPVNLSQLSSLVQRLRNTSLSMSESPWDPITHLYNRAFYSVRLSYALERAKQMGDTRFGILFVDLDPFAKLRECLEPEKLEIFLREIAGHLKKSLRPTDTVARFDDGLFLVLIEDIPDYATPTRIAARIMLDLNNFISQQNLMDGPRANIGIVQCTADYENVEEILGDLEIARKLARSPSAAVIFERDELRKLRGSSQ